MACSEASLPADATDKATFSKSINTHADNRPNMIIAATFIHLEKLESLDLK
jgi:hypothetical protein